jgi:hypothetical protein
VQGRKVMQIRGHDLTAKRIQAEDVSQQRDFYRALCQEGRKTTKGKIGTNRSAVNGRTLIEVAQRRKGRGGSSKTRREHSAAEVYLRQIDGRR